MIQEIKIGEVFEYNGIKLKVRKMSPWGECRKCFFFKEGNVTCGGPKYCIVDFKSGVEWLSKQSPWISVEERLPEYSCWVLVAGKDYKYRILFYCGGKFYTNKSLIAYDGSVLFWMFIPSFDQILEANKDVLQRLK